MTTQPPPAYPTSPPWATPPAAPPEQGPPPSPPYGESATGMLLVPYPEEMQAAARPTPPGWLPVVLWTLLTGPLALLSVVKRADMARRGRNSVAPYWIAWALTMAVVAATVVSAVAVGIPAFLAVRETAITKQVQENIVSDGSLNRTARVTATTASCDPVGPREPDGLRRYACLVTLEDGRSGTLTVTADSDGTWSAVTPPKKTVAKPKKK